MTKYQWLNGLLAIGILTSLSPAQSAPFSQSGDHSVLNASKSVWWDVSTAKKMAKLGNKYIVADVYTDWCGWCKRMDRDTFHNQQVDEYLAQNLICMKVNAEDRGQGQALARRYQVAAYPTVLVIDPSGKLVNKHMGYLTPSEFLAVIKSDLSKNQ